MRLMNDAMLEALMQVQYCLQRREFLGETFWRQVQLTVEDIRRSLVH